VLARYNIEDPYPDPLRHKDEKGVLRPLASCVDPAPIAMTGNYLGFIWHFEGEDARQKWLVDNGFHEGHEQAETMVSLSSGGIFAEAVLGRFNAAEKLDISRFWNWQDSPIPILPPEIAPVQAGSRARDVSTETGQLGVPAVQPPALQALPAPTGTGAALQALTTANIFRDMSGQAEVSAALQKSVELASSGDKQAAQQAGKAMESLMQHQQSMARIAADVANTYMNSGMPKPSLGGQNVSKIGAVLNGAEKADAALAKTPPLVPPKPQKSEPSAARPPVPPPMPNPSKSMPFKTAAYTSVVGELESVLKARGKWQQDREAEDKDTEAGS
jgi:hypothetical protein